MRAKILWGRQTSGSWERFAPSPLSDHDRPTPLNIRTRSSEAERFAVNEWDEISKFSESSKNFLSHRW